MSGLIARIFGSSASGKEVPTAAEAIQKLRETEELLEKKQQFLEVKVENEIEIAKKNGLKNKRVSLAALKRKKRYEIQLKQIDGTLTTIEFQREALENANTNTSVLKVMGDAAKALKKVHADMDIDNVHMLMDDIQEQQEIANEISDAISNPAGFRTDVDEDELLEELKQMEQDDLADKLLDVPTPTASETLPNVPKHVPVPVPKKSQEEDDLKELEAWAQ